MVERTPSDSCIRRGFLRLRRAQTYGGIVGVGAHDDPRNTHKPTVPEIARAMRLPEDTVKPHLSPGLEKLKIPFKEAETA